MLSVRPVQNHAFVKIHPSVTVVQLVWPLSRLVFADIFLLVDPVDRRNQS